MIYSNNAECGEIFSQQSFFQPYRSKNFDDYIYGTMGLIVIIFILLWFGSCMNGCTERNPDTPKDLEWKYKIWRQNNP